MPSKLTDQEKIDIVNKYITGKYTFSALGKEYGLDPTSISNLIKRRDVKIYRSRAKYQFNEHCFDIIDSEDKAYFLGLLYADGCNYPPQNCITISLQEQDKKILEIFKQFFNTQKPIEYVSNLNKKDGYKRKPQCKLSVHSKILSDRLIELGCVPSKSLILLFPTEEQVPITKLRHWLRGLWDGDGSFNVTYGHCFSKQNNKTYNTVKTEASIVGTNDICLGIQRLLLNELNLISFIKPIKNKEVKRLKISKRSDIIKFGQWLYQDSTVFLQRKYEKFLEISEIYQNQTKRKQT